MYIYHYCPYNVQVMIKSVTIYIYVHIKVDYMFLLVTDTGSLKIVHNF